MTTQGKPLLPNQNVYRCLGCPRYPAAWYRLKVCPFCGGHRLRGVGRTTLDMCSGSPLEFDSRRAILPAALKYLKRGWSVIPVGWDKKPLVKWKPYQERLPSEDEIRKWWGDYPVAGIALICGSVSGGVYAVDIDPIHGGAVSRIGKELPQGPAQKTLSGGRHYFFHCDIPLPKRQGLFKGIDFVGVGGYVVLAPSFGRYEWLQEMDDISDLPELPQWMVDAVARHNHPSKNKRPKAYRETSPPIGDQLRFLPELNAACIERKVHWPLAIWAELRAFDYHHTKGRGFVPGDDGCNHLFDRGFSQRIVFQALRDGEGIFWTLLCHGPFCTIQLHGLKRVCETLRVKINITPGYGYPHWQYMPLDDFQGDKRLPHLRSIACYEARDTRHRVTPISRLSVQDRSGVPVRTQVSDAEKLGLLQPTKKKNGRRRHGQATYTPNEQEGPRFLRRADKNLRGAACLGPVGRLATVKSTMEGSRLEPGREGDPSGSPSVTAFPRPWKYFWADHRYQRAVKRAQKGIVGALKVDCNPQVEMPRAERRQYKVRHEVSLWRKPREPASPVCV